jgi:hypothetical protein
MLRSVRVNSAMMAAITALFQRRRGRQLGHWGVDLSDCLHPLDLFRHCLPASGGIQQSGPHTDMRLNVRLLCIKRGLAPAFLRAYHFVPRNLLLVVRLGLGLLLLHRLALYGRPKKRRTSRVFGLKLVGKRHVILC